MGAFLIGAAVLLLGLVGVSAFVSADPRKLAGHLKLIGGIVMLALAAVLAIAGRWAFALPLGIFALSFLGLRAIPGFGPSASAPSGGQRSTVRSAMLEMELDHDSGALRGTIIAGRFDGRELDELDRANLADLWRETVRDDESRALLEAYLDRRQPGWRVDFEADAAPGQDRAPGTGPMSEEEAYQVLGLSPGAGDAEIRRAHRRLMMRVHPDQGGSTFLAAKINEAKDRLLRRHGSSHTRN